MGMGMVMGMGSSSRSCLFVPRAIDSSFPPIRYRQTPSTVAIEMVGIVTTVVQRVNLRT